MRPRLLWVLFFHEKQPPSSLLSPVKRLLKLWRVSQNFLNGEKTKFIPWNDTFHWDFQDPDNFGALLPIIIPSNIKIEDWWQCAIDRQLQPIRESFNGWRNSWGKKLIQRMVPLQLRIINLLHETKTSGIAIKALGSTNSGMIVGRKYGKWGINSTTTNLLGHKTQERELSGCRQHLKLSEGWGVYGEDLLCTFYKSPRAMDVTAPRMVGYK